MRMTLRWPVEKWEKAPLMCRLFGHGWLSGWWGEKPYLRPQSLPGHEDGVGTRHVDLVCRCSRCESETTVAHIHNWEKSK